MPHQYTRDDYDAQVQARTDAHFAKLDKTLPSIEERMAAIEAKLNAEQTTPVKPLWTEADIDKSAVTIEKFRPCRYDRVFVRLRAYESKRDALIAKTDLDPKDPLRLAVLEKTIEYLEGRKATELKRSLDDKFRQYERIDAWRAGVGREEFNAKHRKRAEPNANLSDLTAAQKKQRKADQRSDANFRARHTKSGKTEEWIVAALITRATDRDAKRGEAADVSRQTAVMNKHHKYAGAF